MLNAVHLKLCELMKTNLPFGGKVLVFGGDFRQCLPVIRHGTKIDAIESCATKFQFWHKVKFITSHLSQITCALLTAINSLQNDC